MGREDARRVSMADVALAAGVSGQTVSRVVNGSPRVDPATRLRVERAMDRLAYRPHRAARALRTGRTGTVGLLVSTLASVGNSRMLQAVADAAARRGYALTVVTVAGADAADDAFERLRDQGVDGAIVLNEATVFARAAHAPGALRLVVVDAPIADRPEGLGIVQTDHAAGARAATAHLLELGHRRVALIGGPGDSFAARERERGWSEALAAAGAAGDVHRGDWTSRSGASAGRALADDTTAVFAANDQMALGVLQTLALAGRRVPEDVSVVGFDDVEDAAHYVPALTTVRQDFDELGRRAVDALVAAIETGADPGAAILPAPLVVRSSTAPPPR